MWPCCMEHLRDPPGAPLHGTRTSSSIGVLPIFPGNTLQTGEPFTSRRFLGFREHDQLEERSEEGRRLAGRPCHSSRSSCLPCLLREEKGGGDRGIWREQNGGGLLQPAAEGSKLISRRVVQSLLRRAPSFQALEEKKWSAWSRTCRQSRHAPYGPFPAW